MEIDPTFTLLSLKVTILYGALVLWRAQRGGVSEVRQLAGVAIALMISALGLATLVIAGPTIVELLDN